MIQGIKVKGQETNPERLLQLKQICDMLLAAGYFRARVPVLSPFDKVVGGLVWGITASNVDLDVDIIFQENSTIGERVRVSEQIVHALVRMKCPSPPQPQQIIRLDYPRLFDAVRFLVSRVIETRAETQQRIRRQAEFLFDKSVGPELPVELSGKDYIKDMVSSRPPIRKFKRQEGANIRSLIASAEATLLEFGERFFSSASFMDPAEEAKNEKKGTSSSFSQLRDKIGGEKEKKGKTKGPSKADLEDQKRQEDLKKQMAEVAESETSGVLASGVAGALILESEGQIKEAIKEYDEQSRKASADVKGKQGLDQQFRRLEAALLKKLEDLKSKVDNVKPIYQKAKAALNEVKKIKQEQEEKKQKLVDAIKQQEELEKKVDNKALLEKLRSLVNLNEMLKKQEAAFKEQCKKQKEQLEKKLKMLKEGADDNQTRRMLEIEKLYEHDLSKYNKLRGLLAKKNLQIAKVTRHIDAIPTRAELLQYQRRFVELYELVANKLVETRKYYDSYNMLEEKHRYMVNEVELLNSIRTSVPKLMATSAGKGQLGKNFQSIIKNLANSQDKVYIRFQSEKKRCDALQSKHSGLLQKQRMYFQAVKEFEEECVKNEKLQNAIELHEG
mmetsp:Transcript_2989/g.4415  ORF Transcript_2989/g.4415 Transcript_2989/m.4415 type:complete len:615 (-) Transcript_2989:27-1871(-)